MTNSQSVHEQQSQNAKLVNFAKLPKKTELLEKVKLLDKTCFKLTETRKAGSFLPTPIHKLSMMSMVWNISTGQLGWLSDYAPSQLLHSCSLAEYKKLERVLDFIATTKSFNAIKILPVLNPKHSSYCGEN